MPKVTRSKKGKTTKTEKNPLTRGRKKKPSNTISITDSEISERDTSFDSKSSSQSSKPERKPKIPTPTLQSTEEEVSTESEKGDDKIEMMDVNEVKPEKENQTEQDEDDDEEWKKLPSLTECEFTGTKFPYLTKDIRFREFELSQRKELIRIKEEIEMLRESVNSALRFTRGLCPETKFGKVSNAVQACGFPIKFKDFVLKVLSMETPLNTDPDMQPAKPEDLECKSVLPIPMPLKAHKLQFPSPAKMAKYVTPTPKKEVFHFGAKTTALSTNKAPRLPKPGEVFYSRSGSPIMQRRIIDNNAQVKERVEVVEPDGSKIEVDVVFRGGANDPKKLRAFQELAREFKSVAATRSTVKQNRVMPPRVIPKAHSATKKKPDWR